MQGINMHVNTMIAYIHFLGYIMNKQYRLNV